MTISRRRHLLLHDFTLHVEPGEVVAVMGASGAGKTTLLRTISGLSEPDSGTVTRPPGRIPFVFQDPRLLPWRTVQQNVEVVLAPDERHRAIAWLATTGLADAANVYPLALSGGMRQRAAIARALACHAPLLLVDEPFSHLDITTATTLRQELRDHIRVTKSAVVWVTHNPAEAAEVAQRTVVMSGPPTGGWECVIHTDSPQKTATGLTDRLAPPLAAPAS